MQTGEKRAVGAAGGAGGGLRGVVHPALEIRAQTAHGVAARGVGAEQRNEFEQPLAESIAAAAELLARRGLAGGEPGAVRRPQAGQIRLRRGRAAQDGKFLRAPLLHRALVRREREKSRAQQHDHTDAEHRGPDVPAWETDFASQPPAPPAEGREMSGQGMGGHFPPLRS